MSKVSRLIAITVAAALTVAIALLATWDVPPPSSSVERVLPNDRFPR